MLTQIPFMNTLSYIFIVGSILFSFLTCIILFFRKSDKLFANRLLAVTFAGFIWYSISLLTAITGSIIYMPSFLGLGIPIYYATPVCGYLYTRALVKNQKHFEKLDWIHFLPAIISFCAVVPFYFSGIAYKQQMAVSIAQNFNHLFYCKIGLVPNAWHYDLRAIQCIGYLILQWWLLISALKQGKLIVGSVILRGWTLAFAVFQTLLYGSLVASTVYGQLHLSLHQPIFGIIKIPFIIGAIIYLILNLYLFFFPVILYGSGVAPSNLKIVEKEAFVANLAAYTQELGNENDKKSGLSDEQLLSYAESIGRYISHHRFYMKHGITVNDLANELDLSPRVVSNVINSYYNLRFTDFINSYRIKYLVQRFEESNWREFSFEGLSKEAGFASRSAFFSAFKKHMGVSPSEYVYQLKNATHDHEVLV